MSELHRLRLRAEPRDVQSVDNEGPFIEILTFMKTHPIMLELLAKCLVKFTDKETFAANWSSFAKTLQSFALREQRRHLGRLISLVEKLYQSAVDEQHLSYLRGRLAECLVADPVRRKYQKRGGIFADNPSVWINGSMVKFEPKRTIDVAGFVESPDDGTFLEVKVSPGQFDFEDEEYLRLLAERLAKMDFPAQVGGCSLVSQESYHSKYAYLLRQYPSVLWLGWDDLEALRN